MDNKTKELVTRAMNELRAGNAGEALLILERTIAPKYGSELSARFAYEDAMAKDAWLEPRALAGRSNA